MKNIYRFGGIASFVNAGAGFATLLVVFILIGPEALSNPDKLAEMAVENPTPLVILDILKILTCITLLCIIYILHKVFKDRAPYKIKIGTFFGLISAIFLLANAG